MFSFLNLWAIALLIAVYWLSKVVLVSSCVNCCGCLAVVSLLLSLVDRVVLRLRPSKQPVFGNNLYLVSNLSGVYNIIKSSVVHTSVTTNQQKNNKF